MTTLNLPHIALINDDDIAAKFCYLKRYIVRGSVKQFVSVAELASEITEQELRVFQANYITYLVPKTQVDDYGNI